jgi:CRISPR-associated protein Cas2
MVMMVLRKAPAGLKGQVSRWLQEIGPGVYLGTLSSRVRDRLWQRVCEQLRQGSAVLVMSDANEQGYSVKTSGMPPYAFRDFDGLWLAKRPPIE